MMPKKFSFAAAFLTISAMCAFAEAETLVKTLRADGTGDYATLADAVAAMDALTEGQVGVIVLEPGDYALADTVTLTKPITVKSSTGDFNDVLVWADRGTGEERWLPKRPVFIIENADAQLYGLSISNGYSTAKKCGGGVHMKAAATIDNCMLVGNLGPTAAANIAGGVIRNSLVCGNQGSSSGMNAGLYVEGETSLVTDCRIINNLGDYDNSGLAVNIASGTVRDCIITNNFNSLGSYGRGAGGIAAGGKCLIANCLIADNHCGYHSGTETHGNWSHAAGVHVGAAGCVISNCTIVANSGVAHGGVRANGTGNVRIVNSIIWGNADVGFNNTLTGGKNASLSDANCSNIRTCDITNSCTTIEFGGGNFTCDPLFVDPDHGDYRLAANSPCLGLGCFAQKGDEPEVTPPEIEADVYVEPGDDIHEALKRCGDGSTLHLADGEYPVTRTLLVNKGVRIVSANGPERTSIYRKGEYGTGAMFRILIGDHPDFVLGGVTISNAYAGTSVADALFVRDGTVTNCVFRKNYETPTNYGGGMVRTRNALVTDCLFEDNYGGGAAFGGPFNQSGADAVVRNTRFLRNVNPNANAGGSVILLYGGKMLRCQVTGNRTAYGEAPGGIGIGGDGNVLIENTLVSHNTNTYTKGVGGISVAVNNFKLVNCTLVDNYGILGGALQAKSKTGEVLNCVLYGNTATGGTADTQDYDEATNVRFTKCVMTTAASAAQSYCTGCKSGDPKFTDPSADDYTFSSSSSLKDCGADYVWTEEPPLDLAGNCRTNGVVDVGAYEFYAAEALACEYAVSGNEIAGGQVKLTAIPTGDDLAGLECRWRIDAAEGGIGEWTDWMTALDYYPENLTAGRYKITLEVRNDAGETASTTMEDSVYAVPAIRMYLASSEQEGHVAQAPFETEDTAATNLADIVVYCGAGTEVIVLDGLHWIDSGCVFPCPVLLHGKSGDPAKAVLSQPSVKKSFRMVEFNAEGSEMYGLTMSNGYHSTSGTLGVELYAYRAMVTNCVFTKSDGLAAFNDDGTFRDCRFLANYCGDGQPAAYNQRGENALIEACEFFGNTQGYHARGCINLQAGVMRRCAIVGNDLKSGSGTAGFPSTIILTGSVLMENCLVARNACNTGSGGITIGEGAKETRIVNCTVVSNVCNSANGAGLCVGAGTAYVTNSIVWGNVNNARPGAVDDLALAANTKAYLKSSLVGNFAAATSANECFYDDPLLRKPARDDYRLLRASPCVDKGVNWEGAETDVDLAGKSRVRNKIIDLGCYENQQNGLSILVR